MANAVESEYAWKGEGGLKTTAIRPFRRETGLRLIWKQRYLYLLLLPGLVYFIVYRYVPMLGSVIAFQDFNSIMGSKGFVYSEWVGMAHFRKIFESPEVARVLWNTIVLSFLQIAFAFPVPIVLALLLNELKGKAFKKTVQSIIYLPHFLSWVVVIGMLSVFLQFHGILNFALGRAFGIEPLQFLQEPGWFKPLVVLEVVWKESGWGTIIFLAALAGVNPSLYEAAVVDGANRRRLMWHVTLPALRSTIVILLILRLGTVLDSGFEQIYLMLNSFNREVGEVLDTYVYTKGIRQADFSFGTAVGLFKSVVGLVLVVGANRLARKYGEKGLY